jgi:hypothetical protein
MTHFEVNTRSDGFPPSIQLCESNQRSQATAEAQGLVCYQQNLSG